MIKDDIIFHIGHINYIGGVEQWIYYIAKKYSKNHSITLIYNWGAPKQLKRLRKIIRCVKYNGQDIECDTFISCYDLSILKKENIKANKFILTIHADYKAQNIHINIPEKITKVYAVSELAKKSFIETHGDQLKELGIKCETLYNPILLDEPKRVLKLISPTRLTKEKGRERMNALATALNKKGIPFVWLVFTDSPVKNYIEGFVYMKPRLDITGYIKDADYLVQLSDTEGFAYSIIESLCLRTPIITTPLPVLEEMGAIENKNCYILNFDLSNIDELADKIYNNNLKEFDYKEKESDLEYKKIFGKETKPKYSYKKEKIKVRSLSNYNDIELGRKVQIGDVFEVTEQRLDVLIGNNKDKKIYVEEI